MSRHIPNFLNLINDYEKKADESLKEKFLFITTPNYGKAALNYRLAGEKYEENGKLSKAAEMYTKSSDYYSKSSIIYDYGSLLFKACQIYFKIGDKKRALKLAKDASFRYQEINRHDYAGNCLFKMAESIDKSLESDESQQLYQQGCEIYETFHDLVFVIEPYRKLLNGYLSSRKYKNALSLLENKMKPAFVELKQDHNVVKANLSITIIYLAMDDLDSAQSTYMDHLQDKIYLKARESESAEMLIQAFKSYDTQLLATLQRSTRFIYLDPEVARLAMSFDMSRNPMVGRQDVNPTRSYQSSTNSGRNNYATKNNTTTNYHKNNNTNQAPPPKITERFERNRQNINTNVDNDSSNDELESVEKKLMSVKDHNDLDINLC